MSAFEVSQAAADPPITLIKIRERVNMGNADELEQLARHEFDRGMRNLILDLREMPSITSAGLRAVITMYRLMASAAPAGSPEAGRGIHHAAHLKLLGPSPDVYRILEIAGMTNHLEIYDDLQTAIDSFG